MADTSNVTAPKKRPQDELQAVRKLCLSLHGMAQAPALFIFDATVLGGLVIWNALLFYSMAQHNMTDFGKFYYSVVAFLQGQDMYGSSAAALAGVGGPHDQPFSNMNPPHFHLLLLPLALLPPGLALALWSIASLLSVLASLRLIVREVGLDLTPWQWRMGVLGLLSFIGTAGVLLTGQLSLLLLLPITLAWVEARRGRWTNAGVYLGLALSVKPFLLIFMPYLVFRRQFRAAAAAGVAASLCFVAGLLVFGIEAYWSWLQALASVNWTWAILNASIHGFLARALSPSRCCSPLVIAPSLIKPLWYAMVGLVGTLTLAASTSNSTTETRDRERGEGLITHHSSLITHKIAVDRDFALLLLSSLLISPLGWAYYLWLPLGPLVALAASWWPKTCGAGFQPACRQDISAPFTTSRIASPRSCAVRWRDSLLLVGITGLLWPFFAADIFQPHVWATVSVGSVYFWGTFALWSSLIVDWYAAASAGLTTIERGNTLTEPDIRGQQVG